MTVFKIPQTAIKSALSAIAFMAVASFPAAAHPHQDTDGEIDVKVLEKKIQREIRDAKKDVRRELRRSIRVVRDGKGHEIITKGGNWHSDGAEIDIQVNVKRVAAIEEALAEVRSALDDVQVRLKATKKRSDKKALSAAKESGEEPEKAIEALEDQKEMRGEHMAMVKLDGSHRHRVVEIEQEVVREAIEGLDDQAEELLKSRVDMMKDIEDVREELAEEIADLQIEIDDGDGMHVVRLRALREAELAVSGMEEHHLAAIKTAEAELKRARERLEKKLKEQEEKAAKAKMDAEAKKDVKK